jgi:hypothetical protein
MQAKVATTNRAAFVAASKGLPQIKAHGHLLAIADAPVA